MEKKLQLLSHLYGEAEDATPLPELLQDSDLTSEYQAMSEAKFWLDHSIPASPDPEVVSRILAAAAGAGAPPPVAFTDRAPAPRRATGARKKTWSFAAAALSLVAIVSLILVNRTPSFNATEFEAAPIVAQEAPAAFEADALSESASSGLADDFAARREAAADSGQPLGGTAAAKAGAAASLASAESAHPAWEETEALIQYKSRIDHLLEQSEDLNWDEMVVPLEALPGYSPAAPPAGLRLNEASSTRTGNQ
ncbi:MAG: hypothetical protein SH809_07915 [Rhodothermales bacterium]|nr:hypothetical protein [Rhodothermales bacterium]